MTTEQYMQIIRDGALPSMGERVSYGLTNSLTVILVVFAVLGILYLILTLSGSIFARAKAPQKAGKTAAEPSPTKDDELIAVLSAAALAAREDTELVAVLTAAVQAARAEAGETNSFRVVSFRRR